MRQKFPKIYFLNISNVRQIFHDVSYVRQNIFTIYLNLKEQAKKFRLIIYFFASEEITAHANFEYFHRFDLLKIFDPID